MLFVCLVMCLYSLRLCPAMPPSSKHKIPTFFHIYSVDLACEIISLKGKGKGKAVLLQAWRGSEGSRKLRSPYFVTTAHEGGKVVSLTHWPPLPPRNTPGTHLC
jgi:hypothetical protein